MTDSIGIASKSLPNLPYEMIEHILKRSDSSTLHTCFEIPYLVEMVLKEITKRVRRCLKTLIEIGMNKTKAQKQYIKGRISFVSTYDYHFRYFFHDIQRRRPQGRTSLVTDGRVMIIAQGCPGLRKVDLNGCSNITDTGVIAIARHCPGLTKFDLNDCPKITDTSVTLIAQRCPRLANIDLIDCPNIKVWFWFWHDGRYHWIKHNRRTQWQRRSDLWSEHPLPRGWGWKEQS